jgi:hypothetical protein
LDVYQLADVFEQFRQLALTQDELDPVNYVSVPGLTWDSAFKMTEANVHLLQDEDMYTFFESGLRGGMTFINKHHIQRNCPGDEGYDESKPHTELLYIGKNWKKTSHHLYNHIRKMLLFCPIYFRCQQFVWQCSLSSATSTKL